MALSAKIISAGDPVTSDLINNIIKDLGVVYKETTSQTITLTSSGDTTKSASVSSKVYSIPPVKKYLKKGITPTISFPFEAGWFSKEPRCWVQVASGGKNLSEANLRFSVVLTTVGPKIAIWTIYPAADIKAETLTFHMFATES